MMRNNPSGLMVQDTHISHWILLAVLQNKKAPLLLAAF